MPSGVGVIPSKDPCICWTVCRDGQVFEYMREISLEINQKDSEPILQAAFFLGRD